MHGGLEEQGRRHRNGREGAVVQRANVEVTVPFSGPVGATSTQGRLPSVMRYVDHLSRPSRIPSPIFQEPQRRRGDRPDLREMHPFSGEARTNYGSLTNIPMESSERHWRGRESVGNLATLGRSRSMPSEEFQERNAVRFEVPRENSKDNQNYMIPYRNHETIGNCRNGRSSSEFISSENRGSGHPYGEFQPQRGLVATFDGQMIISQSFRGFSRPIPLQ